MNWRHGLIRVGIVGSVIYGLVLLTAEGPKVVSNVKTYVTTENRFSREIARRELWSFAGRTVVPPALFWVFLYTGFWVASGFKDKQ